MEEKKLCRKKKEGDPKVNGLPFFHSEQKNALFPAQNEFQTHSEQEKLPFPAQILKSIHSKQD